MLAASNERPVPPRPAASAISLARGRSRAAGSVCSVLSALAGAWASSSLTARASSSPCSLSSGGAVIDSRYAGRDRRG